MPNLPKKASAIIIGGGVIGSSVAYHLAKLGWTDLLLLERRKFSCGTTWHAAGLVGTLRANESQARLSEYSMSVLQEIERETGQPTGFKQVGSLSIAHSPDRFEELKRVAAMNQAFGVTQVDIITPREVTDRYPLLDSKGILGGSWVPQDGFASPVDVTAAFIKGARKHGATCIEGIEVTAIHQANGKVTGISATPAPDKTNTAPPAPHQIQTDYIVNCGGLWARQIGKLAGVNIPLHACEHYYAVTEKFPDLPPDLPVMRDHDKCAYYKPEAGGLLVGAFEPNARPWGHHGIPADFAFDELDGHTEEQLMPVLEAAMQRVPLLQTAGWRKFFCGPESFTPDDQYHIGETPDLKNFYIAAGLNSVGIQSSGGVGKALAEWIHTARPPLDLWSNDIRRMHPFQNTQAYLQTRVTETLGLLYDHHYPYKQMQTARQIRHSPIHDQLKAHGACFGEVAGWERPNWFAPKGVTPEYQYSFGKQNWFPYSAAEHRAFRENLALFDQSSFAKYLVQGRDACQTLQRISTANIDLPPGRMIYTHWLNPNGGIEADLTITRLTETQFLIISGAAVAAKDYHWLTRHIPETAHCIATDITNAWAILGVMGPNSRAFLTQALNHDMTTENFPFGAVHPVEIGCATARAARVSFVGELGWELYIPVEMARHALNHLLQTSQQNNHNLQLAGMHALDSGRLEKKFLHYGHDITCEDTPLESGCPFVCDFNKTPHFIGRDALLKQRDSGKWQHKRLVQFLLQDPEAMLYHHEPILRDNKIVGHLTSGNYAHTLGGSVGIGYIHAPHPITPDYLTSGKFHINVATTPIPATPSLTALYDPKSSKMRN